MTQKRDDLHVAPVVRLVRGLRREAPRTKVDHNNPATIEEFEREHMGLAAKE
jgi:hypothetical protein